MAAYLRHRLGSPVTVESIIQFPRGTSRETWFAEYRETPEGPIETLVFRLDFATGRVIMSDLDEEYFIYERLGHTDVPVAAALWWEEDTSWLGRPFYVRRHVEGDWQVAHYRDPDPRWDAVRIATAKEHLNGLAKIHAVDWRGLGFGRRLPVPPSPALCAETYVAALERTLAGYRREAMPIFIEAADWLREQAPVAPRIVLCKGTNGYGEEIFRDGRLVAMSDWEEVSIGDPAADFAFMQEFSTDLVRDGETLWSLDHALAYYREITGTEIPRASVAFYKSLQCFKTLLHTHSSAITVHTRSDAPIRQAWTATEVAHVFKRILAGGLGILPPPPASWFGELNETVDEGAS
jgi:aminoglycoside phosphotransferase (APT) family kinase protein